MLMGQITKPIEKQITCYKNLQFEEHKGISQGARRVAALQHWKTFENKPFSGKNPTSVGQKFL